DLVLVAGEAEVELARKADLVARGNLLLVGDDIAAGDDHDMVLVESFFEEQLHGRHAHLLAGNGESRERTDSRQDTYWVRPEAFFSSSERSSSLSGTVVAASAFSASAEKDRKASGLFGTSSRT